MLPDLPLLPYDVDFAVSVLWECGAGLGTLNMCMREGEREKTAQVCARSCDREGT